MNIFNYGIMLLGFSIILLGVTIILLGVTIWKKQKISLIHGHNQVNIKKEDIKEYTESIGKAYIILGISELPVFVLRLTNNDIYDFIALTAGMLGFIMSMIKIVKTQKKYKTGIWS